MCQMINANGCRIIQAQVGFEMLWENQRINKSDPKSSGLLFGMCQNADRGKSYLCLQGGQVSAANQGLSLQ